MSKKNQIAKQEELEDEIIPIEDILDQLDRYDKEPPLSARSEPFAFNDMLPMIRALAEHIFDLQDELDEMRELGVGGATRTMHEPGQMDLPPGIVAIPQDSLMQMLTVIQTIGFDGALPGSQIPPEIERQLCRFIFCQVSAAISGVTPEAFTQQMKQRYPQLDLGVPDLSRYTR